MVSAESNFPVSTVVSFSNMETEMGAAALRILCGSRKHINFGFVESGANLLPPAAFDKRRESSLWIQRHKRAVTDLVDILEAYFSSFLWIQRHFMASNTMYQ